MKSPITGEEMVLTMEKRLLTYRKTPVEIVYHSYRCPTSGEQFTTDKMEELNLQQVHNKYRSFHGLPFPEEVQEARVRYGLSAARMSEVLGFGVNSYRNYESGEMPSLSNGKMIQMSKNPEGFKQLIQLAPLSVKVKERVIKKITELAPPSIEELLFNCDGLNEYNGYSKPSLIKLGNAVAFFAEKAKHLFKTKLNKLLFYADFMSFRDTGRSITGLTYVAIDLGPVPDSFNSLFGRIAENGFVSLETVWFPQGASGERISPSKNHDFNEALFTEKELAVLKAVAAKFGKTTGKEMVEISHRESAWLENQKEKSVISYDYGFGLSQI